ncbi:translation elongation factor Ts [Candidatus Shikimatogenerans silvanidophilus]|uniref:translation elongation factor Ts n=1 Tax=Candidatus Shikimatogenerans silvanidophilus TaxID=2782547 RepID=UPI001BAE1521|nr:translation elongation factor Ts [Candidatus Shikimatogenerans silvanidophilus]
MIKIKIEDIIFLRKKTGLSILKCKEYLIKYKGNLEKAFNFFKKKNYLNDYNYNNYNNDNKIFKNGITLSKTNFNNNTGVILSILCETDFVAKNKQFISLSKEILNDILIYHEKNEKNEFINSSIYKKILNKIIEKSIFFGEKIKISCFDVIKYPFISYYVHLNKISCLVGFSDYIDGIYDIGKNIAMQIAAMNPLFLDEKSVPKKLIKNEIKIIKKNFYKEKKEKLDNIIKIKLYKFYEKNVLLNQKYIKDEKKTVFDYLKENFKNINIVYFKRFSI